MIRGVVGKINKKPYDGKTLTSFALKGQDGWYSLGERAASFQEGDSIQFSTTQRGRYTYAEQIEPWVGEGATQAPPVGEAARNAGYSSSPRGFQKSYGNARGGKSDEEKQYWAKKDLTQEITQKRIEIQAGRNAAIETAKFLWDKGLVPIPKKESDKYDAFMELVETITSDYLAKTSSRLVGPQERGTDSYGEANEQESPDQEPNVGGKW